MGYIIIIDPRTGLITNVLGDYELMRKREGLPMFRTQSEQDEIDRAGE